MGMRTAVLFRQIQAFIQQHLADPDLCPETIAATHHISIRTLHRLFGEHDLTIAAWIRARRLEHCRRDLTDPLLRVQPIHAIARRWGFTNPPHFTRAFRATYGVTPTDYQQRHDHESSGSVAAAQVTVSGIATLLTRRAVVHHAAVELRRQGVDLPGQLGVGLQLQLLLNEVVVGLGLLEGGLPVLADHHERGQEDGLQ